MNRALCAREEKRFIGLDVYKHYVTVGGINVQQELVLHPRDVEMARFRNWAEQNLRPTNEVVLEATINTWATAIVHDSGRKELRWALVEASWQTIRSNPREYDWFCQHKHPNQAIFVIARKLLVTIWYVLSNKQPYNRYSEEDLAYKMLTWAWHIDKTALNGMTRQQFAKYGVMRLMVGVQLTRIVRGKYPRCLAPAEKVLALKPDLAGTQ